MNIISVRNKKQYQAQLPHEEKEEKAEDFSQTADGKALQAIINGIANANDRACQQALNREENIADDNEAQILLAVLNVLEIT